MWESIKDKNNMESQTNMARWYFAIKFSKKCPEKNKRKIKSF
jgi:hypothetical protein